MDEPQKADVITRDSARRPWDIYRSCDEYYWSPSGRDERRQLRAAFVYEQTPTAVITARVQVSMLRSVLRSLGRLPTVTMRGWTANGDDAHILLSVADPLPTADLNAIFGIEPITHLEPDRDRTAAAYRLAKSAAVSDPVCAPPQLPERRPAPSSELQEQEPIANMNLPRQRTVDEAAPHVVAVLDNGLELDHPYVSNDLWINLKEVNGPGCDADGCGLINDYIGWNFSLGSPDASPHNSWPHGTSVAGLVVAVARSVGAPTQVMPLRTLGPGDRLSLSGLAAAIDYASSHGARTIVIASTWSLKLSPDPLGECALAGALKRAACRQSLVVCAAGNACMDIVANEIEPAYSGLAMGNVLTVLGAGPDFTTSNVAPGHLNEVVVGPAGGDVMSIGTTEMMSVSFGSTSAAAGIIGGASAVLAAARGVTHAAQRKALLLQCRDPKAFRSTVLSDHIFNCGFLPATASIRVSRSTSSPSRSRPGSRPSPAGSAPGSRRPR